MAFGGAAIIIVGATIRMAVLARAREIQIMRLVGATDGFVRLPFLLDGAAEGCSAGCSPLALTWAARTARQPLRRRDRRSCLPGVAALGVLAGALLGFFGSLVSVGRHLRLVGRERRRLWR